jgi:hypothetical protein
MNSPKFPPRASTCRYRYHVGQSARTVPSHSWGVRTASQLPRVRTWIVAIVLGAALPFAASTQAKSKPHRVKCHAGYVRGFVRVPARKHGKIVRRHGKIVYRRVRACIKVTKRQRRPGSPSHPSTPTPPTSTVPSAPPPSPPPAPPVNTGLPTINGTTIVGSMLTATTGSWTNGPTSYAYQWRRCASGACTNITGATGSSYALQSGDAGDTIDVQVTASNPGGSGSATSSAVGPVITPASYTAVAAGDIACPAAGGPSCKQLATETLAKSLNPNAAFVLGDNQYDHGTLDEFKSAGAYNATWGVFNPIVHPVPGNHEYGTPGAAGYFGYFGQAIANPAGTQGYYSFNLGTWHIVALNSNCTNSGCTNDPLPGGTTSAQTSWLQSDLAANRSACVLAMWHHPLFSSGWTQGSPGVAPLWNALYNAHADVVLNGHDHLYESYAPAGTDGSAAADGIREFVVGTGGESLNGLGSGGTTPHLDKSDTTHFGVLKLTLLAGSYNWAFIGTSGGTIDSGSVSCHGPSNGPARDVAAASAARANAVSDIRALMRDAPRLAFAARPLTSSLRAVTRRGLPLAVYCSRKCDVLVHVSLRNGRRLRRIATFFETDEQIPGPYSTIRLRLPSHRLDALRKATLVIRFFTRDAANHRGVLVKIVHLA